MSSPDFPVIRRARGYRLYDTRGNRFLDMYLDNGRALLGHSPERMFKALKNGLEKSTTAEYPSIYSSRIVKAAAELLPGHPEVRIYRSEERLLEVLGRGRDDIAEPVKEVAGEGRAGLPRNGADGGVSISFWRPLLADESLYPDVVVPILPFPGRFAPRIVCGREGGLAGLPESDTCSPVLCAALARSMYDLLEFIEVNRGRDFAEFDLPGMVRRGFYLYPECSGAEYNRLVEYLRREGILLNPEYHGISIVPADYSRGEIKVFSRIAEGKVVWT